MIFTGFFAVPFSPTAALCWPDACSAALTDANTRGAFEVGNAGGARVPVAGEAERLDCDCDCAWTLLDDEPASGEDLSGERRAWRCGGSVAVAVAVATTRKEIVSRTGDRSRKATPHSPIESSR